MLPADFGAGQPEPIPPYFRVRHPGASLTPDPGAPKPLEIPVSQLSRQAMDLRQEMLDGQERYLAQVREQVYQREDRVARRALQLHLRATKLRRIARRLKRARAVLHGEVWPAIGFAVTIGLFFAAWSFRHWLPIYVGGLTP